MKLSTAAKTNLILASLMGAILVAAANVGVPPIPYQTLSQPEIGLPVNNGYPSLARNDDGDLWLAWISRREPDPFKKGEAKDLVQTDHILLKRRDAKGWSKALEVGIPDEQNSDPVVVTDGQGALVVWSWLRRGNFDLFARHVEKDLKLSEPVQLTKAAGANANPRVAAAPDGTIWLVWESFRNGHSGIYAMSSKSGVWSAPALLSNAASEAYRPALAVSDSGVVSVVWDGGPGDRYLAFFRQKARGQWNEIRRVASPEGLDSYAPKVAAAHGAAAWVAYAQNPRPVADWGIRGFTPGLAPRPNVRVVFWSGERWQAAPGDAAKGPGFIATNADMPDIVASEAAGVHVIMLRIRAHLDLRLWVSDLGAKGWSEPKELGLGEEEYQHIMIPGALKSRVDQRPSLVADGSRVLMAYERGMGWFQNRQIAVREFPGAPSQSTEADYRTLTPPILPPVAPIVRNEHPISAGYRVYFGDIHTHLLMDDGWTGTADQFYAFARDRRRLDFGAYTPHAECNKLIGAEVRLVERIAAEFNQPGRFVAIPGWEWTQGDFRVPPEGHKHILNETDGQPFFSSTEADSDTSKELSRLMRGTTGLMFAHHVSRGLTGGANYDSVDPAVEPDVEITSHWGRFEYYRNPGHTWDEVGGSAVQDAWAKGLRLGVVGGSDNHDLFMERGAALTAVLTKSLDRHAIFDALRNRRCYATTGEKIVLDVRVNGSPMGSVIRAKSAPVVAVKVTGTDLLEKIEIVKFSKGTPRPFPVVYSIAPTGKDASFEWKDLAFAADCSYYVRVTQRADPRITSKKNFELATAFPNEMAWSSPVWVEKK